MTPVWWSFLLTGVGVLGLFLAGRKNKAGWAVGLFAQVLWIAYASFTHQWGFYVSAVAYGWVYARNWVRWKTEERAKCPHTDWRIYNLRHGMVFRKCAQCGAKREDSIAADSQGRGGHPVDCNCTRCTGYR